jgi:hypothetical protein
VKKKEIDYIIDEYHKRASRNNSDERVGLSNESYGETSKFMNYRGKQLDVFLSDAMLLKDITYTNKESACSNPTFKANSVQYYYLSKIELRNYFTFRTLIQKGKKPNNDWINFFILYVMEIINGIYQNKFETKYKLLIKLNELFPKGAKYNNILIEAFEILYFQNMSSLDFSKYCRDVPLKIFMNYKFIEDEDEDVSSIDYISDSGITYATSVPSISKIIKMISFKSTNNLTDTDLYLFEQCFSDVITALDESKEFSFNSSLSTDSVLMCSQQEKFNIPIGKLRANFPLTTNVNYKKKGGDLEIIRYGFHCKYSDMYPNYDKDNINKFLLSIVEMLRHYCGKVPLRRKSSSSYYPSYYLNPQDEPKYRKLLMKVIKNWIANNQYVKDGLYLSPAELEEKKDKLSFKLDISDITNVRLKSHEIQTKLIVEENEINPKINKVKSTKKPKVVEPKTSASNEFELLIVKLKPFECDILLALINGDVYSATKIADNNGTMLSIIVDNINIMSSELIEDVVIIDNVVLDYSDELQSALKILKK